MNTPKKSTPRFRLLLLNIEILRFQRNNTSNTSTNIYDYELEPFTITPRADIVTLIENSDETQNDYFLSLHKALLRNSVGLYVTVSPQKIIDLPKLIVKNSSERVSELFVSHPAQVTEKLSSSENIPKVQSKNDSLSKTSTDASDSNIVTKPPKKSKAKKEPDILTRKLSELHLDNELELRLLASGYRTIQDLIPNKSVLDLDRNKILNRKNRRQIKTIFKKLKILE